MRNPTMGTGMSSRRGFLLDAGATQAAVTSAFPARGWEVGYVAKGWEVGYAARGWEVGFA